MEKKSVEAEYPIKLIEDFSKNFSKETKYISIIILIINVAVFVFGLIYKNYIIIIISLITLFFISIWSVILDDLDDRIELTVDERGISIFSDKSSVNRIFLEWKFIESIAHPSEIVYDGSFYLRHPIIGIGAFTPRSFPMNEHSMAAQAIVVFRLPQRPEWREGREWRTYTLTRTFGMSQTDFIDFLKRHFERNRPAQIER